MAGDGKTRIAIIGAGAAGLCAANWLANYPQFSVVVIERNFRLGGMWDYRESGGALYRGLCTNLPTSVMAFPEFDFPFDTQDSCIAKDETRDKNKAVSGFCGHRAVLRYLQSYAAHACLKERGVKFQWSTEVTSVTVLSSEMDGGKEHSAPLLPVSNALRWRIESVDLKTQLPHSENFEGLVVATGHYAAPQMPSIEGDDVFPGRILHAFDYDRPEEFDGFENVVVVGGGPSGTDICAELLRESSCRTVHWSLRPPSDKSATDHHERLQIHSVLSKLDANGTVYFNDGEEEESFVRNVNAIIFATGYVYDFPFLDADALSHAGIHIETHGHNIEGLWRHIFAAQAPSLGFIGLPFRVAPFPLFDRQSALLSAVWAGRTTLPSFDQMKDDESADMREVERFGWPPHFKHCLGPRQWSYMDQLAHDAGAPPLKCDVRALYNRVSELRTSLPNGRYRYVFFVVDRAKRQIEEHLPGACEIKHFSY